MAVKFGVWRIEANGVSRVAPKSIDTEERLETILESQLDILGLTRLFLLGRQVVTKFGKRVDLLAVDGRGALYVIELKKDRTPREVVAQALEYGYWAQNLTYDEIAEIYSTNNNGDDFESAFTTFFEGDLPESLNLRHHLLIVATGIDASTEQIIEYVRSFQVPIDVLFFEYFKDGDREYLARSWLTDPEVEAPATTLNKKQAPWNGRDFFVAIGENEHRNWDDMRRYGFVSAGHGEKYRKAMTNLFEGARVWAAIPGTGYVGVGEVVEPARRVLDFHVKVDGSEVPILDAPLQASNMGDESEDAEKSEYLVRVHWIDTKPRQQALWEKGMFANQNVVSRLRHQLTLRRLEDWFDLAGTGSGD